MESPLHYIFQAAMGQCSTLPGDGNRNQAGEEGGKHMAQSPNMSKHRSYQSTTSSNSKKQVREARDTSYYGRPGDDDAHRHNDSDVVMGDAANMTAKNSVKHLNTNEGGMQTKSKHAMQSPQYASGPPKSGRRSKVHVYPTAEENIPLPPEGAVRTRCYRLNLDAPVVLSPTHDHLGPFPYDPPAHHLPTRGFGQKVLNHVSQSDESVVSVPKSATQIAINTARIFRGITTDKNGVILSQNARASRSKNGKDRSKQADKSRQGNKIEKAMDLVDEDGGGSGKENDQEKSNMASLIVVGEYDDMKQLVRDGAKKLRDNDSHPDESLMALNRSRHALQGIGNEQFPSPMNAQSRKRLPSQLTIHHTIENPTRSRSRSRVTQMPHSNTPPKLKGHPRDRPTSRRNSSVAGSGTDEKSRCNDISLFGGGDSDWSEALDFSKGFNSIWNCGGTGGNNGGGSSPIDSASPKQNGSSKGSSSKLRYEGRNETSARFSRGGGVTAERDAPGVIL